jgi:hypothetical protein
MKYAREVMRRAQRMKYLECRAKLLQIEAAYLKTHNAQLLTHTSSISTVSIDHEIYSVQSRLYFRKETKSALSSTTRRLLKLPWKFSSVASTLRPSEFVWRRIFT